MSNPTPPVVTTTPADSSTSTSAMNGPRISISQILDEVRNRHRGQAGLLPWHTFPLQEDEYADLLKEVAKESDDFQEYWEQRLRHDYFPSISTFVLRKPTITHVRFIIGVLQEVIRQLRIIESEEKSPVSDFARQIHSRGASYFCFPDEYGRHDPDGSFGHENAQYPGVIFEVSYPQKRKNLGRLADDYILGSDAKINVVVGLNIDVQPKGKAKEATSRAATVSVWRPKINSEGGVEELTTRKEVVEFRDKDGIANSSPSAGLFLRLGDFAIPVLHPASMSELIFIPATTLSECLAEAERQAAVIMENKGARIWREIARKRKRTIPLE